MSDLYEACIFGFVIKLVVRICDFCRVSRSGFGLNFGFTLRNLLKIGALLFVIDS